MNVLVIEDDRKIARLLERGLSEHGHLVSVSGNGQEAAEMIIGGGYDAALLDILLPGIDGLAVLERVRAKRCKTAIMMLTAVDARRRLYGRSDISGIRQRHAHRRAGHCRPAIECFCSVVRRQRVPAGYCLRCRLRLDCRPTVTHTGASRFRVPAIRVRD